MQRAQSILRRVFCALAVLSLAQAPLSAQEAAEESEEAVAGEAAAETETSAAAEAEDQPEGPRTMSGMSILGNEEAPKSLVIIPWKSSELGDDLNLANSLDDQARPVDKDVFLRELRFYEIRSGQR